MPAAAVQSRPGIYSSEILNPSAVVVSAASSSIAAFVCLGMPRGPVVPTLVTSYLQFQQLYGAFVPGTTPSAGEYAVWQFFASGGGQCYVSRVLSGPADFQPAAVTGTTASWTAGSAVVTDTGAAFTQNLVGARFQGASFNGNAATTVKSVDSPTQVTLTAPSTTTTGGNGGYTITPVTTDGTATATLQDREGTPQPATTVKALNPGTWGNSVTVSVTDFLPPGAVGPATRFNLRIAYARPGGQPTVEYFTDLSANPADVRYYPSVVNGTSQLVTVTPVAQASVVGVQAAAPAAVSNAALVGGTVGGAYASGGLAQIAAALLRLTDVPAPLLLNLVGVTDAPNVNQALAYAVDRKDTFVVIDPVSDVPGAQYTAKNSYLGPEGGPSSFGAVYYPSVVYTDPAGLTGQTGTVTLPPGPAVMALTAINDARVGVHRAPAGDNAVLPGAIGLSQTLSRTDLDTMNVAGVNALRTRPSGVCIYGVRTMVTLSRPDRYVGVRRTLTAINAQAQAQLAPVVFEPNTPVLRQQVKRLIEGVLTRFVVSGALAGSTAASSFYVICDATNNSPADIANGVLRVDVGVAPSVPAEFIAFTISVFNGSVSVTTPSTNG